MGADATLVQGAYNATKYTKSKVDAATKGLGDSLSNTVGKLKNKKDAEAEEVKKAENTKVSDAKKEQDRLALEARKAKEKEAKIRLEDFNAAAEEVRNADGSLPKGDFVGSQAEVEELKKNFLSEDPIVQAGAKHDLATITSGLGEVKDLRLLTSTNVSNNDFSAGMSNENQDFYRSTMGKEPIVMYKQEVDGDGKPTTRTVGVKGPDGEWMSTTAYSSMMEGDMVDVKSQSSLLDLKTAKIKEGTDGKSTDVYDGESVNEAVTSIIKGSSNVRSLMYDVQFGTTSFVEDLSNSDMLNNLTYDQLGITAEDAYILDKNHDEVINEDDKLTKEDREMIAKNLADDPDLDELRNDLLKNYLSSHVEKSWNKAHKAVVAANPVSKPSKVITGEYNEEQSNVTAEALRLQRLSDDYIPASDWVAGTI